MSPRRRSNSGVARSSTCSPQRAESIRLTQHQTGVSRRSGRPAAARLRGPLDRSRSRRCRRTNETVEFSPFYSLTHHRASDGDSAPVLARVAAAGEAGASADRTEVFLSLVDTEFSPRVEADWTLDVMTTCLNPRQLPFGGGQPRFQLDERRAAADDRVPDGADQDLRPLSHVHDAVAADLAPDAQSPVAREPRRECRSAPRDSEAVRHDGFRRDAEHDRRVCCRCRPSAPVGAARRTRSSAGVCRGLEVTLHFDEDKFSGSGLYPVRRDPGAVSRDVRFDEFVYPDGDHDESSRRTCASGRPARETWCSCDDGEPRASAALAVKTIRKAERLAARATGRRAVSFRLLPGGTAAGAGRRRWPVGRSTAARCTPAHDVDEDARPFPRGRRPRVSGERGVVLCLPPAGGDESNGTRCSRNDRHVHGSRRHWRRPARGTTRSC